MAGRLRWRFFKSSKSGGLALSSLASSVPVAVAGRRVSLPLAPPAGDRFESAAALRRIGTTTDRNQAKARKQHADPERTVTHDDGESVSVF